MCERCRTRIGVGGAGRAEEVGRTSGSRTTQARHRDGKAEKIIACEAGHGLRPSGLRERHRPRGLARPHWGVERIGHFSFLFIFLHFSFPSFPSFPFLFLFRLWEVLVCGRAGV